MACGRPLWQCKDALENWAHIPFDQASASFFETAEAEPVTAGNVRSRAAALLAKLPPNTPSVLRESVKRAAGEPDAAKYGIVVRNGERMLTLYQQHMASALREKLTAPKTGSLMARVTQTGKQI